MEKFKSKKEFSVFSLWNIREIDQKNVIKKSINFNNNLQQAITNKVSQEDTQQNGGQVPAPAGAEQQPLEIISKDVDNEMQTNQDEDDDMALPNDAEDMHKMLHQRREELK